MSRAESDLTAAIEHQAKAVLEAYRADPDLVEEHAAQEREIKSGGYGRRQLFELVQNAADQLQPGDGRIHIVLTADSLYCANGGEPFSKKGIESILHAFLSRKQDDKIGRFGLGFKSVLGVTSSPAIVSRSGSFRFATDCAARIRDVVPDAEALPLLRMAAPMDPGDILADDPIAASLAEWAATVIVLPFDDAEAVTWLDRDVGNFPVQFLTFASQVEELVLEDRAQGVERHLTAERSGDEVLVKDGDKTTKWLLFEASATLSEEAATYAGKLADRDEITVKWAVPPGGTTGIGSFWSYFPTVDETTLRGVLNAPWQLTDDRLMLVEGPYNEALLRCASRLVVDAIPDLQAHSEDPTTFLELLPGRGKEPRCWADGFLTDDMNERLSCEEAIPLQSGELGIASQALLHPPGLPSAALKYWQAGCSDSGEWVDHRIDLQKDRRARVERYLETQGCEASFIGEWFDAVLPAASASDEEKLRASMTALNLLGALGDVQGAPLLRHRPCVLAENGGLVAPAAPGLMIPGDYEVADEDVILVHPDLVDDEQTRSILVALGVPKVSAAAELRRLVTSDPPKSDGDWDYFWSIVADVPDADCLRLFDELEFEPHVRVLDGGFRRLGVALLPGRCVPADGTRDGHVAVDQDAHRNDLKLLQVLGLSDAPRRLVETPTEPWFEAYSKAAFEQFLETNHPAKPSRAAVTLERGSKVPQPLAALPSLSEEGKAAMVEAAIEIMQSPGGWTVRHSQSKYRVTSMPNPAIWWILEEGLLATAWGPRAPQDCIAPGLAGGAELPAPKCREEFAVALELPTRWSEVPAELIAELFEHTRELPPEQAADVYAAVARDPEVVPPAVVRCSEAGRPALAPPGEVLVSDSAPHVELLAQSTQPMLGPVSSEAKDLLVGRFGMRDAAEVVRRRVAFAPQAEPIALIDLYPPLRQLIAPADRALELVRCTEIRIVEEVVGGTRSDDVSFYRDGDRLLCDAELADGSVLREVGRALGLEFSAEKIERILKGVENQKIKDLVKRVRKCQGDAERLELLLSEDRLRARLPKSVIATYTALHGEPSHSDLADLAICAHGASVLKAYEDDLEELGLTAPSQWAGTRKAREFVRSLGFSGEFAGFESDKRPAELIIEGRPTMPPLHDYQELIAHELATLMATDKNNRAMLSLPTGAGKTRVAIEGIIEAIKGDRMAAPTVLWVAQSGELCEQAVVAWSELWRARELDERLVISRLWAENRAEPARAGFQVVVATIQKLQGVIDDPGYEWLRKPGALIIDEAHGAIAASYTKLLSWMGMERGKFGPPTVGLSATPYRGRSEEQTERLAARFGKTRLDVKALGDVDHYPLLQERGVISHVSHETLEGADLELTAKELEHVRSKGLLPKAADTRLGENIDRTQRVLASIIEHPEDWPILVFAPSVENAQVLAGLLKKQGVSAAAIHGEMPNEARRFYIKEFRERKLRVITNYNVLAEGFDAPSVRAVYIARPVYAPNRYQQMVGRGLRGPLNGGKRDCLIVDVEDNVLNFDQSLAFREFEYLWMPEESTAAS